MVIEELKAKSGFGGAQLEINIPKTEYKKGEHVHGEVHLLGGNVAQKINNLYLRLVCEWNTESYAMGVDIDLVPGGSKQQATESFSIQTEYELHGKKGKDEIVTIKLASDIEINAGQRRIFPFDIVLPIIKREKGVREIWKLLAQADIPFAKDSFAEREIKILTKKGSSPKSVLD